MTPNIKKKIPNSLCIIDDVDFTKHLDLHLPGYEFLWNCAIFLKPAVSGVGLQF